MLARLGALGVILAVLVTAGCSRAEIAPGEARLRLRDGAEAVVAVDGGRFTPVVSDHATLRRGDRVRLRRGIGFLDLRGGASIELRRGSDVNIGRTLTLRGGDVLVVSRRVPVGIAAAGTTAAIEPRSVVRVNRALAYELSVYDGGANVESAGRRLRVPRLRAASVPAIGLLPARPGPVVADADDPWDRRHLGVAIQLTSELDGISDGFTTNFPSGGGSLRTVLDRAVPGASARRGFDGLAFGKRRPGDSLVGVAIATSTRSSFAKVFGFRDEGATWGIVVMDQRRGDRDGMVQLLRRALDRAPVIFRTVGPVVALPPRGPSSSSSLAAGATPAPGATAGSSVTPPSTTPPGGDRTLVVPPVPGTDADDDANDLLDTVVDIVDDVAVIDAAEPIVDATTGTVESTAGGSLLP